MGGVFVVPLIVGWILGWCIRMFRAVWWRTTTILRAGLQPQYVHVQPDPLVERMAWWRAALGLSAVLAANIYWRGIDNDLLFTYADDWFTGVLTGAILICVTAIVPSALLFCCAPPGSRWALARFLWIPVRVPLCLGLYLLGLYALPRLPSANFSELGVLLLAVVPLFFSAMIVLLWVLLIILLAVLTVGLSLLVRYYGRAADGHPTLPALMAITLGLALAAVSALKWYELGPEPAFPVPVAIALAAGGPMSLVVLGWWELRRLRHRGIGLRWSVVAERRDINATP